MKRKLFFFALLILSIKGDAQTSADLDVNNIKARLNAGGDLFWDFTSAKFEAPKGSGINSIFAANLWIGGYDVGNQLHIAAQTYRQNGTDYWPGPLDTITITCPTSVTTSAQWNRVWKINKTTIDSFKLGLFTSTPASIANWPGNGDPVNFQGHYLAPFHDTNYDGLYIPADGDYPIINGDQAVLFIYNDHQQGATHGETGGAPLGLDIIGMAYSFKCIGDSALNNTIFIHYKIINRSSNTYSNSYIGMWTDFDIGLYSDDYVGSDVTRQCYYGYNGVATDGNSGPGTYGNRLGAQSVVYLNGPIADANDGIDNNKNCIVDEPGEQNLMSTFHFYNNDATAIGNPGLPIDYYYYISGMWRDTTPMTYGGNGHNTGSPCKYMFPANSDQTYGWGLGGNCVSPMTSILWDEASSGNIPGDRRGIGSSGKFTMLPNSVHTLDLAYVFGRDYTASGIQQSLNVMNTRIDSIRSYFSQNSTPCGNIFNTSVADVSNSLGEINVYPNPASDILFIDYKQTNLNTTMEVYDITGKKLFSNRLESFGKNQTSIKELSDGLYFIRIIDGDKIYSKKFIKE